MHYKKINKNGVCMDEHRYIMQQHLGRKLSRHEVVHHDDENKLNNDLSNLKVMSLSEHSRLHAKQRVYGEDFSAKMKLIGIASMPNKLTADQVLTIKQRVANGEAQAKIAREYNVSKSTICGIVKNRTWNHLKQAS